MISLILGGARSGKSRHAEQLATDLENSGKTVIYIATATTFDDEMTDRIKHHQNNRPSHWQTIEAPIDLANVIREYNHNYVLLIDCLTLWVSNLLMLDDDVLFNQHKNDFLTTLQNNNTADIIMVSNETGLGVIPMGQLTRRFVDESGFLHQQLAKIADKVVFCVAGLQMNLK